ncbi:glycoside hydrolase family 16 protein [Aureobasidium subglaciale EXF-2481]|uniref:endo-1,3(4)-beta-glucanase n=1 Tax=Aureobasidium subglaciale (strain EXF-2481) TaxID=1043005 RepID=A0A074ZFS8_AURSE|nr:glycoside hydrolase family 16 protein [Aureobasidium subglaciale EXF-2481]KAI5197850.1 putative endo-1,3(4)-beta-glucanase [Aureobasidium subglaciale]KAI5216647.1 putative endo-1,3(4)-beta-glucanase [Aureobasidium subglaciale]KAI5219964.1 putative endo-1,3(4)-beta-glucanase [Aureobasidium subglaciale]KAI5257749.1 putative endo-1,3(4)-beta-glucanase [Aureobasidium subglaciale]KEQ97466.1 glycoside hydrolase family 16 protein [Aureobasidium subglaciale EXF-2481]
MEENKAFLPQGTSPETVYQDASLHNMEDQKTTTVNKLWPSNWSKKTRTVVAAIGVIVIILVTIPTIIILRRRDNNKLHNTYPDYHALNYTLSERWQGTNFFDNFDYHSTPDPAAGFVNYLDQATAESTNLTYAGEASAFLRADSTDTNAKNGRSSVRITSKKQFHTGLFVFDVKHTPYGCGTWPAVWMADPSDWPGNGEIDVVETVNQGNTGNQMALHTSKGCKMYSRRVQTGTIQGTNCYNGTNDNAGCAVMGASSSYGAEANDDGGAVYAMELRKAGIRMWIFNRDSPPGDLRQNNDTHPDPSSWGFPIADFPSTNCNIESHFKNQSIIANIDFCGSWASSVYSTQFKCPGKCEDFVATNASAFEKAYWEFASFRIYSVEE